MKDRAGKDQLTDRELDRALDEWKSLAPSPALRARVLAAFPRQEPRGFWRPLRWAAAIAVGCCMIAIATGQTSAGVLDRFATGVRQTTTSVEEWFDQMYIAHVILFYKDSHPRIYVDGELQTGAVFGGSAAGAWLRVPGEGKYYIALTRSVIEGPVPAPSGRFDGRLLEFQTGGRSVRIESTGRYGFGGERPVWVRGPIAGR